MNDFFLSYLLPSKSLTSPIPQSLWLLFLFALFTLLDLPTCNGIMISIGHNQTGNTNSWISRQHQTTILFAAAAADGQQNASHPFVLSLYFTYKVRTQDSVTKVAALPSHTTNTPMMVPCQYHQLKAQF